MSDSEAVDVPSDTTISRALKEAVFAVHKSGKTDELTVKRIRARVEQKLSLPTDFFKTNPQWKNQSNQIIHNAVDELPNDEAVPEPAPTPKPKASKPSKPQSKSQPTTKKANSVDDGPRGVKRPKQTSAKQPTKRRKTAVSSDEESDAADVRPAPSVDDELSDVDSEPPKKPANRRKPKTVVSDEYDDEPENGSAKHTKVKEQEEEQDANDVKSPPAKKREKIPIVDGKADQSESELSSLIDESPVKKKRQKKDPAAKKEKAPKATAAKSKAKSAKPKAAQDDDPEQAEIKRLQGWLVKCGIRKVWSKELARCNTAKEKIRHLKKLLSDAGMEGKYSVEKAAKIKEQREFAAELEAIQEGEKFWGTETNEGGRPRRAAARRTNHVVVANVDEDSDEDQEDAKDEKDGASDDDDDDSGNDDNESEQDQDDEDEEDSD